MGGKWNLRHRLPTMSCWSGRPQKPLNNTVSALVLGCPLELDGKTLLPKIPHALVMHREIYLEQGLEFSPCWVFLSGGNVLCRLFYPAVDAVCYNNDLPGKLKPLDNSGMHVMVITTTFGSIWSPFYRREFIASTVNLTKNPRLGRWWAPGEDILLWFC